MNKILLLALAMSFNLLPAGAQKWINRDRMWHYISGTDGDWTQFVMQFGNDTVIDGRTYTEFSTTSTLHTYYSIEEEKLLKEETGPGARFFLREEGRKLWIYNPYGTSGIPYQYYQPYQDWKWGFNEPECLLYDFSLPSGKTYLSIDALLSVVEVRVTELIDSGTDGFAVQKIEYLNPSGNKEKEESILGRAEVIEGIGFNPYCSCEGTLVGPELLLPTGGPHYNPPYPYPYGSTILTEVTDLAGNIIYKPKPVSIDEVLSSSETGDAPIYNLMGLPVRNPQPGSIYIRNGKKFVMK